MADNITINDAISRAYLYLVQFKGFLPTPRSIENSIALMCMIIAQNKCENIQQLPPKKPVDLLIHINQH